MLDYWNVGQAKKKMRRNGESETRNKNGFSPYLRISLSLHQHAKRRYKDEHPFQSSKKFEAIPYPCHQCKSKSDASSGHSCH